jgi:hypothetical protein
VLARASSLVFALAAAVLLTVGLLHGEELGLVYLSIACSVAGAVLLVVASRRLTPD